MAAFGWRGWRRAKIHCPSGSVTASATIDWAFLAVIIVSLAYVVLAA